MDSETDSECEDLGMIRPNLIRELRNVLDEYPDDDQILKELIQNAEDAGATTVKILTDARCFNQELDARQLKKHPHLKYFRGPALCVYNDAEFTDRDWLGIRMLHTSVKEKDPLKVGRFGLGFKSVFHMTDRLMILSGKYIMYMDPFKGEDRYCKRTLVAGKKGRELQSLLKSLEGVFGVTTETFSAAGTGFPGTIFWFPLRQASSELCSTVYSQPKVQSLLTSFRTEASSMLLFLNSIQRVDIFSREDEAAGPEPLFLVGLASTCIEKVCRERKKFLTTVREAAESLPEKECLCVTEVVMETTVLTPPHQTPSQRESWLVLSYHPGQEEVSEELSQLCAKPELSYRPFVGVAFPLTGQEGFQSQVFCFLPLPMDTRSPTGLPVNVNGYFALSQNRRHLKWPTADQLFSLASLEPPLQWNCLIVKELLPRAYAHLLKRLKKITGSNLCQYYTAWPDIDRVDDRWRSLLQPLYFSLTSQPSFYSEAQGGQWINLHEAVLEQRNQSLPNRLGEEYEKVMNVVIRVYSLSEEKLVRLPEHVQNSLRQLDLLQNSEVISAVRVSQLLPAVLPHLSRTDKLHVLHFLCCHDNCHQLVRNQELLPLANGSFGVFENTDDGYSTTYWCPHHLMELFPGLEEEFCDSEVSTIISEHLHNLAFSGQFSLRILEESDPHIPDLIARSLQVRFGDQQPSLPKDDTWIQRLWEFLSTSEPWCQNLSSIFQLTLLPWKKEGSVVLLPLAGAYVCNCVRGMASLTPAMTSCLIKLGLRVFSELPDYVTRHPHVLGHCVQFPSTEGLLNCLTYINDDARRRQAAVEFFNGDNSAEEREALIAFIVEASNQTRSPLEIFHQLQLFNQVAEKDSASVDEISEIAPDVLPPLMPHRQLLSCSPCHRHAAIRLGAREVTLWELVFDMIEQVKPEGNQFSSREIVTFMKFVLGRDELIADRILISHLRCVKFVPDSTGHLRLAEELYDPNSEILQQLFLSEEKFPAHDFIEAKLLKVLGLRDEDMVKSSDIISTAELIQDLLENRKDELAVAKAEGLWELLTKHSQQFDEDTLGQLSTIRCLPCQQNEDKPSYYPVSLPFSSNSKLAKPKEMCLPSQAQLTGSVLAVIREGILPEVAQKLQVGVQVDVKKALENLDNILSYFQSIELTTYRLILSDLFCFLGQNASDPLVVSTLTGRECVLSESGDCFAKPRAFWTTRKENDIQLRPYKFLLPNDMQSNKELFLRCGAVLSQDSSLLKNVLIEIQARHSQKIPDTPEFHRDLSLVKQILDVLKDDKNSVLDGTILLPIFHEDPNALFFKQAKECTVASSDGFPGADEELFFVHPEVRQATAIALGALKMKDRALTELEDLDFEQKEELTNRLHNLLKDSYTDGFSVPKELIQNADDAGATEVYFLLDERENEDAKTNLISDNMHFLQGPAFWAYNNATFSDTDFENIRKLGAGTKKQDATKVGRFGLGFNSVYNLTDVPSFLSRHVLAMFDPHIKYLKGRAGLKLDFRRPKNHALLSRMPGQFKPYQGVFGCKLHNSEDIHFNGTLFRFPLRTAQQDSQIKSESYSKEKRREFLRMLLQKAGDLLMFTQSVKRVKVFYLPPDCSDPSLPQCLLDLGKTSTSCVLSPSIELGSRSILQYFTALWPTVSDIKVLEDTSIELLVTKEARSVCDIGTHSSTTHWRLAWTSGTGASARLARQNAQEGWMPVAAVAAPTGNGGLESLKNSPQGFYKQGHLFCFLPLPDSNVYGALPVHVNATFALASSRRSLFVRSEDDLDSTEGKWNDALVSDALSRAYVLLLENVQSEAAADFERFFALWPAYEILGLSQSFWRRVVEERISIFSVPGNAVFWVAFEEARFLSSTLRYSACGDNAWRALRNFWALEGHIVDIPAKIYSAIEWSDQREAFQARVISEERFYRYIVFPNIESSYFNNQQRDELVVYALLQENDELDALLQENRCIPCAEVDTLKRPSELIHPRRAAAKLYLPSDGTFPRGILLTGQHCSNVDFCSDQSLRRLEELNMITDELPWHMVLERAASIMALANDNEHEAHLRAKNLIDYLAEYTGTSMRINSCPPKERQELSHIQFLPVLKKPADWPFPWAADRSQENIHLAAPSELYSDSLKNLVACYRAVIDSKALELSPSSLAKYEVLRMLGFRTKEDPNDEELFELSIQQLQTITQTQVIDYPTKIICSQIYSYLAKSLKCIPSATQSSLFKQLPNKVIWTEKGFVEPAKVAVGLYFDCQPYLFQLEADFRYSVNFFKAIGVKETFDVASLTSVLQEVYHKYEENELPDHVIKLISRVAQLLSESVETGDNLGGDDVFLPDRQGLMKPVHSLCLDDCEWLKETEAMKFVSETIPVKTARLLGVKSKRMQDLESLREFIPFGQSERLTNRIKRLLEGYPFDSSLFKELLQNADDAGATEIRFIKDPRCLGTRRVLEGYSSHSLQGPALCVFNNKSFTKQDMAGIRNLGQGSKDLDALKTGQYGVGFNAVYHITDAPSFWTLEDNEKEAICIFDPHCQYVPDTTPSNPGIKLTNIDRVRESYPDMFAGYLGNVIDRTQPGTLFRFPLRTEQMANTSEIRTEAVTMEQIIKLLDDFKNEIGSCLLFLNNLQKITIHTVQEDGHLNLESEVSVNLAVDSIKRSTALKEHLLEASKMITQNTPPFETCLSMTVTKRSPSSHTTEEWLIVHRLGFEDFSNISSELASKQLKEFYHLLPRGGVAVKLAESSQGRELPRSQHQVFCVLPLPIESDLPVHVNGHFALDHETRRNLWVNKSDSRTEWNELLVAQIIVPAYLTSLQWVKDCWFSSTENLDPKELPAKLRYYHSLFPALDLGSADQFWTRMKKILFREMARQELPLFPVLVPGSLPSLELVPAVRTSGFAGYFNNLVQVLHDQSKKERKEEPVVLTQGGSRQVYPSDTETKLVKQKAEELKTVLLEVNMKVLEAPYTVYENFRKSDVNDVRDTSPENVIHFLRSCGSGTSDSCNIINLPQPLANTTLKTLANVQTLLKLCIPLPDFPANMCGLPLCLRQSGNLYTFQAVEENDKPIVSEYFSLFATGSADIFIHESFIARFLPVVNKVQDLMRTLDIPTAVTLLPKTLSKNQFRSGQQCKLENNMLPSPHWLSKFWEFIESKLKETDKSDLDVYRKTVQKSLQDLKEWSLIPVKMHTGKEEMQNFLYPVKYMHKVVFLTRKQDQSNSNLWTALRTMNLPFLDTSLLHHSSIVTNIVASINYPEALLQALSSCARRLKIQVSYSKCILEYFNNNLPNLQKAFESKTELQENLKCLPLYRDIKGELTDIAPGSRVLCLKCDVPFEGTLEWAMQRSDRLVLLQKSDLPEDLMNFLEFESLTTPQFYYTYLLPTLSCLPWSAIPCHITVIRIGISTWPESEQAHILQMLRMTEFIELDEQLYRAGAFYSSYHPVFYEMCRPCDFPPPPYSGLTWKSFLTSVGMISEVTEELFLRFARALQDEGKSNVTTSTEAKTKILLTHLFERKSISVPFLRELREIRFICQSEWPKTHEGQILSQIAEPFNCQRLVSFAESCQEKHVHLVWSTCSIVHPSAVPCSIERFSGSVREFIPSGLYLEEKALKKKVILHVQNVCQSLVGSTGQPRFLLAEHIKKVMMKIYEYLRKNIDDKDIAILKELNIICDIGNKQMLKPENVVFDLREEEAIRDHIVKAPRELGDFFDLFKKLGASERVTANHYAIVLSRLKSEVADSILHVEEFKLVVQTAVRELFNCLRSRTDETRRLTVDHVFLPSKALRLVKSTELICIDNAALGNLISQVSQDFHFFLGFKELNIAFTFQELKLLPNEHQLQLLSRIVKEIIPQEVKDLAVHGSHSREAVSKISSPLFADVVVRLAYNFHNKNQTQFSREMAKGIVQCLRSISVLEVIEGLRTVLTRDGVTIQGTECYKTSFVEKKFSENRSCTVFLDRQGCDTRGTFNHAVIRSLRIAVLHVIEMDLNNHAFYIDPGLTSPHQAMREMDEDGLLPCDFNSKRDEIVFPPPGTFIPVHLHCFLDNSLGSFYNGEHVGYEIYDPQIDEPGATDNNPVYLYAIVLEEISQGEELPLLARRYRIGLGADYGETEAPATRLYKFVRRRNQGTTTSLVQHKTTKRPEGTASAGTHEPTSLDFKSIMKEIRKILSEAWQTLDEKERNRVVKRLYLKWHPDKNIGNEKLCTRIVQLLQHYVNLLKQGRRLPEEEDDDVDGSPQKSSSGFSGFYSSFFENMNRRSHSYRDHFYQENNYRRGNDDYGSYHYRSYSDSSRPNPQPGEGRRWFRQAERDLRAAKVSSGSSQYKEHNWVCFQCHQASEKALKAVLYYRDANSCWLKHHDIAFIASTVSDATLSGLAQRLQSLVGSHVRMRYPDVLQYPSIPADMYSAEDARQAYQTTDLLLQRVRIILDL